MTTEDSSKLSSRLRDHLQSKASSNKNAAITTLIVSKNTVYRNIWAIFLDLAVYV